MESDTKTRSRCFILIFVFLAATLGVLYIEVSILGRYFLRESLPRSDGLYLVRMYLTALASFSLVAAIFSFSGKSENRAGALDWAACARKRRIFWVVMATSVMISLVFIFNPPLYARLRKEDGIIESLSAILAVAASIVFWIAAWRTHRSKTQSALTSSGIIFLGLVLFLIGMEEISWFQRILEFRTPLAFSRNVQLEMNFHNIATNEVENAYYFAAFLVCVLIPFIHLKTPFFQRFESLVPLIPSPHIIFIGAIVTAYNYDMWNILLTQYAFFITVAMIAGFRWQCPKEQHRLIATVLLILLVFTQAIYLLNGQNFKEIWHVTEYKELLIPLTFLVYALELNEKVNQ